MIGRATAAVDASLHGLPFAYVSESPLAFLIINNRLKYLRPPKIRKQRRRHIYLTIRELPEEKIGDAKFAACADQQIDVRQAVSVEISLDVLLGYLIDRSPISSLESCCPPARLDDLCPPAVVESYAHDHSVFCRRHFHCPCDLCLNIRSKAGDISDSLKPDIMVVDLFEIASDIAF